LRLKGWFSYVYRSDLLAIDETFEKCDQLLVMIQKKARRERASKQTSQRASQQGRTPVLILIGR
jgi:hypothetical protein